MGSSPPLGYRNRDTLARLTPPREGAGVEGGVPSQSVLSVLRRPVGKGIPGIRTISATAKLAQQESDEARMMTARLETVP
jgi:hypothetical protein